jgi:hypothetical protein
MDRGRVGEDRGSKEADGCPLTKGVRRTNVGSMNTRGDMGRPRIDSNSTTTIHPLHLPIKLRHPYQSTSRTYKDGS